MRTYFLFFAMLLYIGASLYHDVYQARRSKGEKMYYMEDSLPRDGFITTLDGTSLKRIWLPKQKDEYPIGQFYFPISIKGRQYNTATYGTDFTLHYANAYFLGFVPFEVETPWSAMNHISRELRYQLDHKQFRGYKEIWQTSKEAYANLRGDCEDHAILLADWLETQGYDARVAIGKYKGQGHAWVVLLYEGKTYLLEATSKRSRKKFPLAKYLHEYRPEAMFNSEFYWHNTGTTMTTSYTNHKWKKTARFQTPETL